MSVTKLVKYFFKAQETTEVVDTTIELHNTNYQLKKIKIDGSTDNIKASLSSDGLATPVREIFKELIKNLGQIKETTLVVCLWEMLIDRELYLPAALNINNKWIKCFLKFENIKDQELSIFTYNLDE